MSRNENEDVSHLNLPDPISLQIQYYMEDGDILDDEQFDNLVLEYKQQQRKLPFICAKSVHNINTKINTYFVLCAGSLIFDPRDKDSRYRSRHHWKMRRVNKSTYNNYIRFLRTSYTSFLHQAERGL